MMRALSQHLALLIKYVLFRLLRQLRYAGSAEGD
jgi:hypothetical protein